MAGSPDVAARLVELYKRGRAGYLPMLLASDDVRAIGRMARGVAAVAELDRVRIDEHRRAISAEIGAKELAQVRAVHEGTAAFAAPFTGFGTLVIVDHGAGAYSLYGHLSQALVTKGASVKRGSVVGSVGHTPAGAPALYFELRIDGRPVDPVQWLRR